MANRIPRLSLQSFVEGDVSERARFTEEIFRALREYGFFILTEHTIKQVAIYGALSAMKRFFSLPQETKSRYQIPGAMGQRGYTGFGLEQAIQDNEPDPKEYWHMGRESFLTGEPTEPHLRNVWPAEVPGFRPSLLELFDSADRVSKHLLKALGDALGTPLRYFEELTEDGNCVLRCLHYPPIAAVSRHARASFRAAPHKDINFFTILVGETSTGLQFRDNGGSWLDVEAEPGAIVVDSGEMLSLVTNDLIKATTHRVVIPEDGRQNRYSMVFLVHPRPEAELSCLDSCKGEQENYSPITAQDFLLNRIAYWQHNKA